VARLQVARLTDEDRRRPELYAQEAARRTRAQAATSPDDYLRSLQIVMTIRADDAGALGRLAQLCQKTNQFNLTTRRHREADLRRFMDAPDAFTLSFSLADVLGDSGLVGLAVVTGIDAGEAEVDTLLMSCRVIGRRAETAFLRALLDAAARRGVRHLRASYEPTARNGLVAGFWPRHGFAETAPGRYERDLLDGPAIEAPPITVVDAGREEVAR
jgi:FkbH-like protein